MAIEIKMPQLGLTMTEGVVARWFKTEGDSAAKGELLCEVETDKLTNEVQSEADGILLKIIAPAGTVVPVRHLLAIIGQAGEQVSLVSGTASSPNGASVFNPQPTRLAPSAGARVKASPLAKKIAAAKGIDLSALVGSGPGGRIVRRDVERAPADWRPALTIAPADAPAAPSGTRRERMSGMRRAISKNMKLSWETSPAVHYNMNAEVAKLAELKALLAENGIKATYTDLLAKIVCVALAEFPLLNASAEGEDIIYHDYINLGIAVALDEGLVVPVVRDAQRMGVAAISERIKDLSDRARQNTLASNELSGGTFTITNLGMFGVDSFTPLINQPECAILGVNAIKKVPREAGDGSVVFRPVITLSLTADHRLVDGAVAAKFLRRVCDMVENPWKMII